MAAAILLTAGCSCVPLPAMPLPMPEGAPANVPPAEGTPAEGDPADGAPAEGDPALPQASADPLQSAAAENGFTSGEALSVFSDSDGVLLTHKSSGARALYLPRAQEAGFALAEINTDGVRRAEMRTPSNELLLASLVSAITDTTAQGTATQAAPDGLSCSAHEAAGGALYANASASKSSGSELFIVIYGDIAARELLPAIDRALAGRGYEGCERSAAPLPSSSGRAEASYAANAFSKPALVYAIDLTGLGSQLAAAECAAALIEQHSGLQVRLNAHDARPYMTFALEGGTARDAAALNAKLDAALADVDALCKGEAAKSLAQSMRLDAALAELNGGAREIVDSYVAYGSLELLTERHDAIARLESGEMKLGKIALMLKSPRCSMTVAVKPVPTQQASRAGENAYVYRPAPNAAELTQTLAQYGMTAGELKQALLTDLVARKAIDVESVSRDGATLLTAGGEAGTPLCRVSLRYALSALETEQIYALKLYGRAFGLDCDEPVMTSPRMTFTTADGTLRMELEWYCMSEQLLKSVQTARAALMRECDGDALLQAAKSELDTRPASQRAAMLADAAQSNDGAICELINGRDYYAWAAGQKAAKALAEALKTAQNELCSAPVLMTLCGGKAEEEQRQALLTAIAPQGTSAAIARVRPAYERSTAYISGEQPYTALVSDALRRDVPMDGRLYPFLLALADSQADSYADSAAIEIAYFASGTRLFIGSADADIRRAAQALDTLVQGMEKLELTQEQLDAYICAAYLALLPSGSGLDAAQAALDEAAMGLNPNRVAAWRSGILTAQLKDMPAAARRFAILLERGGIAAVGDKNMVLTYALGFDKIDE